MSQIIEVTVSPKGETKIETKGFAGSSCRDASQALEVALGVRQSEQLTSAFYGTTTTEQRQPQGQ